MDQVALAAEATALALTVGAIISMAQERVFGRILDGRGALVLNALTSLAIGTAAVARVGGVTITAQPGDPIAVAIEIVKSGGLVLIASQAAFRVLVKPVVR